MSTANIYLTFDGECEVAFTFYQSVLGGEIPMWNRFGEMPPQEGMPHFLRNIKTESCT